MQRVSFLSRLALGILLTLGTVLGCGSDEREGTQSAADSIATTAPHSDILLAPLTLDSLHVGSMRSVTQRRGYDNQPAFSADGTHLYWTSIRGGQSDVYRQAVDRPDSTERVTTTPESEYSPTLRPRGGLSVVRVESDGRQRLWHYTLEGAPVRPIFPDADSIGYHAWLDSTRVAVFVLGSPPTLHVRNVQTGTDTTVASRIGRSLQSIPGRPAVSYVRVRDDSSTVIHELSASGALRSSLLARSPGGGTADFHAWTPDGRLLMAAGGRLWAWEGPEGPWIEARSLGSRTVTRLAVSPTGRHLALVEDK